MVRWQIELNTLFWRQMREGMGILPIGFYRLFYVASMHLNCINLDCRSLRNGSKHRPFRFDLG